MFNFWWLTEWSKQKTLTEMQNNEKGPLRHQKIKCSFLDYVQLLMIKRAIQANNIDQNTKKQKRAPKSSKNQMFIFGLCSTSDDRPSNLSIKRWPKCTKNKKGPQSHWKIKCSFLDYIQLLMIGQTIWAKNADRNIKKGPLSYQKIKCSFLDYVQLLMIDWVIQAKNIDWNAKQWKRLPKSSKNQMFIFGLRSTSDDWLSDPSKKHWPKCKKTKKAP